MTSEEFNKHFDLMQAEVNKLRKAESLADTLGYYSHYCDGAGAEWEDEIKAQIDALVGNDWPQSVKDAYNEGAHEGYMDT